jgi:hypothetical protein
MVTLLSGLIKSLHIDIIGYNIQKNNIKLATKESKYSMYKTVFVGDVGVCRSFINSIISTIPDKNTGTTCH